MKPPRADKAPASREEGVPLVTVAVGETEDGHFCACVLTTQGDRVLARELLAVSLEAEGAAEAWRMAAHLRIFSRQEPTPIEKLATAREVAPYKGADVALAHGLGLHKQQGQWALCEVHTDGATVTAFNVVEASKDFLYLWERLDVLAARTLLRGDRRAA
jgi:hypothetical protein